MFFFGNQVSSIMLKQPITVSTTRQKKFSLEIDGKKFESDTLFYPVEVDLTNIKPLKILKKF